MCLCPLQLSCIYPFSPLLSACRIRLHIASNRLFQNISVGFSHWMIKNYHVLDWEQWEGTLVNIAVSPLPELQLHNFHLCGIRWNPWKIHSVDFSRSSGDSTESDCLWDDVQHWDSHGAFKLLWLDIPIDSGTGAFGQRLGRNASILPNFLARNCPWEADSKA